MSAMKKSSKSAAKKTGAKVRKTAHRGRPSPRRAAPAKPAPAGRSSKRPRPKKSPGADIDNLGDLPRGSDQVGIFAVAQEPHCLFCYWDYRLTENAEATVFLRHGRESANRPEAEVPVPADANSWYVPARDAGADYYVELGFYNGGHWKTLARSRTVLTPRDAPDAPGETVFARVPFHSTLQELAAKLRGELREGESLTAALARLQGGGDRPSCGLAPAQQAFLDSLLDEGPAATTSAGLIPSSWGGARGFGGQTAGNERGASWDRAAGDWSSGAPAGWSTTSSWGVEGKMPRDFFLHLNAEVIFYGGTRPDARLTVGGQDVGLRPDGAFRFHFVFPDGDYEIPVIATSPDGRETRRAVLRFERATVRRGDVGATEAPPLAVPPGRRG